jgi:hypothetical protein
MYTKFLFCRLSLWYLVLQLKPMASLLRTNGRDFNILGVHLTNAWCYKLPVNLFEPLFYTSFTQAPRNYSTWQAIEKASAALASSTQCRETCLIGQTSAFVVVATPNYLFKVVLYCVETSKIFFGAVLHIHFSNQYELARICFVEGTY